MEKQALLYTRDGEGRETAEQPAGSLSFLYRTLPCMLYDCVIGLLLYPIAARLMVDRPRVQPGTPVLR